MKLFLQILVVSILMTITFNGYTQTNTVIDYTGWNPSNPSCNLFGGGIYVPATVGSTNTTIFHGTLYGQPQYNATSKAVELPVNYINPSDTRGTQYRLSYNFKSGYSYRIVVNAAEKSSTAGTGYPLYMRLAPSNSSGSTNAPCTGPDNRTLSTTGATVLTYNATFNDYPINLGTLSNSSPSLDVTAYPGNGNNAIEISKITITETAPSVSFTLPSTTNVSCGSTSPLTFTVTTASNPNNLPISNYTWNLGAVPNGWLYNGTPAPQTISTGTINTLTLIPNCGSALSNISATVTAGGNQYNTNTSTINVISPALSIAGDNALCSASATYSVANLPCNASVTWTASPSNIVSLSCTSCNSTTITQTGVGNVTLTATVTSPTCSNLTSPTKIISVGNGVSGYYNVISNYVVSYNNTLDYGGGSVFLPKNQSVLFSIQLTSTNLSNVSWIVSGTYSTQYNGSNFLNLYMTSPSASWSSNNATVTLNATGACGSFSKQYNFQAVANGSYSYSMKASPNPATNMLNVAVANIADTSVTVVPKANAVTTNTSTSGTRISLYDSYRNALIKQWTFADKAMNYNLNISGVPSGVYILKLEREGKTTTTKVVVQ